MLEELLPKGYTTEPVGLGLRLDVAQTLAVGSVAQRPSPGMARYKSAASHSGRPHVDRGCG